MVLCAFWNAGSLEMAPFAQVWKIETHIIEGVLSWVVHKDVEFEVSEHQLAKDFISLEKEFEHYEVPHPLLIHGKSLFFTFFLKEETILSSLKP